MKNNMDKLPFRCYAVNQLDGKVILLEKGMSGYYPTTNIEAGSREANQELVDMLNKNITKAQVAAMYCGSMFGWNVPGADPDMYDENGNAKKSAV